MKWLIKALFQKVIGFTPWKYDINYFFQHRVFRNLPSDDTAFFGKVDLAVEHYNNFIAYSGGLDVQSASLYEFGAGWDLIIPLTYYSLGINNQTLIDIDNIVRCELINNTIQRLAENHDKIESIYNCKLRTIDSLKINSVGDLYEHFGIRYLAPVDARKTDLEEGSFDFISSTTVLEHIPENDILLIMNECRRILNPNGVISMFIDLKDHCSYFDGSITHYNFMKYSVPVWRIINSSLMYQNRMRYPDYTNVMKLSNFDILKENASLPDETDLEVLDKMPISKMFLENYKVSDLGVKTLRLILKKKNG